MNRQGHLWIPTAFHSCYAPSEPASNSSRSTSGNSALSHRTYSFCPHGIREGNTPFSPKHHVKPTFSLTRHLIGDPFRRKLIFQAAVWVLLWMDRILRHFESMGNHSLLVFMGGNRILLELRWCRISSHSMWEEGYTHLFGAAEAAQGQSCRRLQPHPHASAHDLKAWKLIESLAGGFPLTRIPLEVPKREVEKPGKTAGLTQGKLWDNAIVVLFLQLFPSRWPLREATAGHCS